MNCTLAFETRIGARRINQDRIGHWRTERALLMVVADGLGGHPRGELAAQISIDHFSAAFMRDARPALTDPREFLVRAMTGAHAAILREAYSLDLPDVPRTVIVACVVQDGHAYWAHIGDCRLYLVRAGRIASQTRDHTVVQHLVDAGRIAEEAVATHPEACGARSRSASSCTRSPPCRWRRRSPTWPSLPSSAPGRNAIM